MTEVTSPAPDGHRALKSPAISFEFFPPKTEEMEKSLWETIKRLAPLAPSFVSVTYGAGGSTRERTHATIARILAETSLMPAAHLTCVGAARGEIDEIVARYHEIGVRHIVALRGDPPGGIGTPYAAHPDGYQTSAELVAGIKKRYPDIEVSVSAYPEKHPESRDFDADIDMLKAKVDAGATRAITQVFFDNDLYFRYLDRVRARGIDIPIVPGIMPMHNFKQARNFVTRAGTTRAGLARGKIRGPRRRRRDPQAGGGDRCRRPGAETRQARRRHLSFLHHEPRRPRVRDLPSARHPPQGRAESRLTDDRTRLPQANRFARRRPRAHPGARRRHGHHDPGACNMTRPPSAASASRISTATSGATTTC